MSKGTGSVPTGEQRSTAEPWSGQAPYLKDLYAGAANLPQQEYYPGQTVVGQSPETQQALGMTVANAQAGAALNQPRQDMWQNTLQGDYLYGGAGFNAALDAAHNKIAPMVQGQFASGGRYGSGLSSEAETSALGDAFAGLYAGERQNQMTAMGMASPEWSTAYRDAAAMGQVGQTEESYTREQLEDDQARWDFEQQAPGNLLAQQSGIIQAGNWGGTQTQEGFGRPGLLDIFGADLRSGVGTGGIGAIGNIWDRIGSYGDI